MHDDHIGSDDEFHGSIPPTPKMAETIRPEVWKGCLSFLDDPIATRNRRIYGALIIGCAL